MFARRLLLLFAMLMLLASLAAQVAPEPEREGNDRIAAATQPPEPADGPRMIDKTLTPTGEGRALVEASLGDTVRLTVEHDRLATIEVRGLDRIETVAPEAPAIFEIYAERPGTFPLVVLESDREFARLEVTE